MKIDQGLFKLDFTDHHAVLGLPISADARAVRKRYLAIARRLHPDSMASVSEAEAQRASELLSKWVNPAYEVLSQEKTATEYQVVLKLKGQSLRQVPTAPAVITAAAQTLIKASPVDTAYRQAVNAIAVNQYDQLDQVMAAMGQLSELNLVYLYRTSEGSTPAIKGKPAPTTAPPPTPTTVATAEPTPRPSPTNILESYFKRAQEFERDRDFSRAILEMREALKTYPNSARCHSYLASLYLKAGQNTMARVHAKRALDLKPDDEMAKAVQGRLENSASAPSQSGRPAKTADKGSGGFLGLFGGKKK
ncbi:MAG TPA: DnaJ domain-containing protein [Leptolyngbyaceae cyanobacterium M65_K2018_010]|nr:DnaJ domain-containing protein [Leptolyngbyaceae cyanobacterium M65_K2018_010]